MKGKVCPIMSRDCEISCNERCVGFIPEQTHAYRCTCDIKNEDSCPQSRVVDMPDEMILFCDGCSFFKKFKIKPVPEHCALMNQLKSGVIW